MPRWPDADRSRAGSRLRESSQRKIGALVYVGDCCEEPRDHLVPLARRLADQNIPIFIFQEGLDPQAETIFREIAQITKGAYQRFDQGSAKQLGELLRAVAVFATGGVAALETSRLRRFETFAGADPLTQPSARHARMTAREPPSGDTENIHD